MRFECRPALLSSKLAGQFWLCNPSWVQVIIMTLEWFPALFSRGMNEIKPVEGLKNIVGVGRIRQWVSEEKQIQNIHSSVYFIFRLRCNTCVIKKAQGTRMEMVCLSAIEQPKQPGFYKKNFHLTGKINTLCDFISGNGCGPYTFLNSFKCIKMYPEKVCFS